jgi:hypothetical protein
MTYETTRQSGDVSIAMPEKPACDWTNEIA